MAQQELFQKICTYLRTGYEPVDDVQDADFFYTTEELRLSIEQHILEPVDGTTMYNALVECGYRYFNINLKPKWCLRKV